MAQEVTLDYAHDIAFDIGQLPPYPGRQSELNPGERPAICWCEPIPEQLLPLVQQPVAIYTYRSGVTEPTPLPEHSSHAHHPIVSESLKQIVEELEPGIHQFIPIPFLYYSATSNRAPVGPYFFLNILTFIPPVLLLSEEGTGAKFEEQLVERSDGTKMKVKKFNYTKEKQGRPRGTLTFNKAAFEGRHLWRIFSYFDGDCYQGFVDMICASDELRRRIEAQGLTGVAFRPIDEI